jgi:hypothetical protein
MGERKMCGWESARWGAGCSRPATYTALDGSRRCWQHADIIAARVITMRLRHTFRPMLGGETGDEDVGDPWRALVDHYAGRDRETCTADDARGPA